MNVLDEGGWAGWDTPSGESLCGPEVWSLEIPGNLLAMQDPRPLPRRWESEAVSNNLAGDLHARTSVRSTTLHEPTKLEGMGQTLPAPGEMPMLSLDLQTLSP